MENIPTYLPTRLTIKNKNNTNNIIDIQPLAKSNKNGQSINKSVWNNPANILEDN